MLTKINVWFKYCMVNNSSVVMYADCDKVLLYFGHALMILTTLENYHFKSSQAHIIRIFSKSKYTTLTPSVERGVYPVNNITTPRQYTESDTL